MRVKEKSNLDQSKSANWIISSILVPMAFFRKSWCSHNACKRDFIAIGKNVFLIVCPIIIIIIVDWKTLHPCNNFINSSAKNFHKNKWVDIIIKIVSTCLRLLYLSSIYTTHNFSFSLSTIAETFNNRQRGRNSEVISIYIKKHCIRILSIGNIPSGKLLLSKFLRNFFLCVS